jgi:hypothetical protein
VDTVFQQKRGGSVNTKQTEVRELWKELLGQNPTNYDLRYVIEYVEPLRAEAWQKLLEQNPTNADLRYVVRYVEPLRAEAWQKLLEQNPTNADLRCVIEYVESLRAEAEKILREREKPAEEPPKPVVRERTKEDILRTLRDLSS